MALGLTFPATSSNNTIVGRMTNDNTLAGIRSTSFRLRRADTDAQLQSSISVGSVKSDGGKSYWEITVQNTSDYRGLVYVQISAFSFWDNVLSSVVPRQALDSNAFRFSFNPAMDPPSNFSGVAGDETVTLSWTMESGQTYEIRRGSGSWSDATSPHIVTGLTPETSYTFQVRVKAGDSGTAGTAASVTVTTLAYDAPTSFAGVASMESIRFTWDMEAGKTYELRQQGGSWRDVASPHTVTGLRPETEYVFDLRIKKSGSVPAGNISTLRLTTPARDPLPVGPLTIESIDAQFIPVGTKNYELSILINRENVDARVRGLQEGFYQIFRKLGNGNSEIRIRSDEVTRLIEDAIWVIGARDLSDNSTATLNITYNVVPVGPILVDPKRQTLYKGVPFNLLVETLHKPSVQRGESELVGFKSDSVTIDERDYIQSVGVLPVGSDLTFSEFDADYYVENAGGSDSLKVPFDIRGDAVAPKIGGLQAAYTVEDGAAVNIPFTVTATPEPVVTLDEGLPDWLQIEHVSGTNYRLVGTSPGVGTYEFTVVATGLGVVTHDVTMTVRISVETGIATRIGSANQFGVNEAQPSGLAFGNDTLYMVGGTTDALYSIDTTTGVATRIGSAVRFGVNEDGVSGLAFGNGTLYMSGSTELYSVDTGTGVAILIGERFGGLFPNGLAFGNGTLYMAGRSVDALYSVDPATGIATRIGSASQFGVNEAQPSGLAFGNDTLYMVGGTTDALYSIDTTTGVATRIGSAVRFGVNESLPNGLAFGNGRLYMVGRAQAALFSIS